MCLAVPMKIVSRDGERGECRHGGVTREVDLCMVPDALLGDYVMVHAGFAIQRYDAREAELTLDILREVENA